MLSPEHRVAIPTPASTATGDRIRHPPAVCTKGMNSLQTSGVSLGFIQTCAGVSKANWVTGNLLPTEPSAFEDEAVATAATLICVTLLIPCDSPARSQLPYPCSFCPSLSPGHAEGSTRQLCGNGCPVTHFPLLKKRKHQNSSCPHSRHQEKQGITPASQRNSKYGEERPGKWKTDIRSWKTKFLWGERMGDAS